MALRAAGVLSWPMGAQGRMIGSLEPDVAACRADPALHFCIHGRIKNKANIIETPIPNIFQLRMQAAYTWFIERRLPPRIFGLKPRQVGGSTVGAHLVYHHARNFNARGLTIADTNLKSDRLWEMIRLYAEQDSLAWGDTWRHANGELYFAHGSTVVKRSAEAPRQTRGDTFQIALISEAAWFRSVGKLSGDETMISLINALADHHDTLGIIDTTPHGKRGASWEFWRDARWPWWEDGEDNLFKYWRKYPTAARQQKASVDSNAWLRVFASWWEFPEHSIKLTPGEVETLKSNLDEREVQGIELYGWTWGQIAWRRWCIRNKCRNSVRRMDEEYPEDPAGCWLASGGAIFDSGGLDLLDNMANQARPEVGLVTSAGNARTAPVSFGHQQHGWCHVWERPAVDRRYLISVDPMRGERDMATQSDRDHHAVQVWRKGYREKGGLWQKTRLVARIATPCQVDNSILARQIDLLSRWYGRATVAVETNMGFALLAQLRDNYGTNLYVRERYDRLTSTTERILGWSTTEQTRQVALDCLIDAVRDRTIDVECPELVRQMAIFEMDDSGKGVAPAGDHDDEVLAAAIGLACMEQASVYREAELAPTGAPDEGRWEEM
jgi:hypothetical protein